MLSKMVRMSIDVAYDTVGKSKMKYGENGECPFTWLINQREWKMVKNDDGEAEGKYRPLVDAVAFYTPSKSKYIGVKSIWKLESLR